MKNSYLNGLPAELRNLIYEYVLYEPQGADILTIPGLLQTCSIIRHEAELMFYAINRFTTTIHEELMNHDLCDWLRCKAGQRLNLIQSLDINVQMPSISDRHAADHAISRHNNSQEEEDGDKTSALGFLQLMHTIESIRSTTFKGRSIENVVNWTLNGAGDSETFESISRMPVADQDSHRGAKFLVLCMVHGESKTLGALHADDPVEELTELDRIIEKRRAGIDVGAE